MSETSTATCESRDPHVDGVDPLPATGRTRRPVPVADLATYYRLRCIALESTVASLEARLDRTERRAQRIRDHYEELLQQRESAADPVYTR